MDLETIIFVILVLISLPIVGSIFLLFWDLFIYQIRKMLFTISENRNSVDIRKIDENYFDKK